MELHEKPIIDQLIDCLDRQTFVVETIAHLQGKEKLLLPLCDLSRQVITNAKHHTKMEKTPRLMGLSFEEPFKGD